MIEISLGVIAVAFVILVIFLVITLLSVRRTLQHVNKTLVTARHKIDEMSMESMKLIRHSNDISEDLQHKLLLLDSIFQAVSLVGDHALDKAQSFRSEKIEAAENQSFKSKNIFSDLTEWVATGMHLWHTIKKGR